MKLPVIHKKTTEKKKELRKNVKKKKKREKINLLYSKKRNYATQRLLRYRGRYRDVKKNSPLTFEPWNYLK